MAWQKTGYQKAVEYDPDRHVLRYGTYEFHGDALGLKRDTVDIDPTKIKSVSDVYLALGADPDAVKTVTTANKLYGTAFDGGGLAPAQPFSGKDAWKNDAAQRIYATLNPEQQKQPPSVWGESANKDRTAIDTTDRTVPRMLTTQKLDTGLMQFSFSDPVPADYDFVNRISSMANALSASTGGDLGNQRPRRRTATGAF